MRLVRGGQSFGFWALAAARTGTGSGVVTSSPVGINCGSDCTENYSSGTRVTLTATPESNSTFAGWSGDCTNSSGTCTVAMTSARNVTANFSVQSGKTNQSIGGLGFTPATLSVGEHAAVRATSTSNLPVSFRSITPSICAVLGNTVTPISTGTCTVAANQGGNINYNAAPQVMQNIIVRKGNQTISPIYYPPIELMIGTIIPVSATATSGLSVSFVSDSSSICIVRDSSLIGIATGTCIVAAIQSGNVNYNAATKVTTSLIVVEPKVVLLLHGMNSGPETWNNLVNKEFNTVCKTIYGGKIEDDQGRDTSPAPYSRNSLEVNTDNVFCYRIRFDSLDSVLPMRIGADAVTAVNDSSPFIPSAMPSAGDFSTFNQLGKEVNQAIKAIHIEIPNVKVILVGHSRGGLAARAFLQNKSSDYLVSRGSVLGLITIGTPHLGSPFGDMYNYLKSQTRNSCNATGSTTNSTTPIIPSCHHDWQAIDLLISNRLVDLRRPTIGDLSPESSAITMLNRNIANLPNIKYGELLFDGALDNFLYYMLGNTFKFINDLSYDVNFIINEVLNYPGDGIVPLRNQTMSTIPDLSVAAWSQLLLNTIQDSSGIFHNNETSDDRSIENISSLLRSMFLSN